MYDPAETSVSTRAASQALKALLVNPLISGKFEHLHIGLCTVGSYVEAHSEHRVRVLDFMAYRKTWRQALADTLRDFQPDLVGLYISTPYFPAAQEVAEEIKRISPETLVVAGGHHATLSTEEVMACAAMDMAIVGEGEKPFLKLMDSLASGAALEEVPGLWWREDGAIRQTPKATLLAAPDMPCLNWSLHDEKTLDENFFLWGILPVMASRGCPAACSFCSITAIQRLYEGETFLRFRDPIEVVDEIEASYRKYAHKGLRIVFFYDLNFLLEPTWVAAFVAEYKRRGLNRELPWSAYTRADHVKPEVLPLLEDSGCVNLRVGIEAANPHMRNDIYKKDVSQAELEFALEALDDMGVSVTGYFIAGGPGERPEWLIESLGFARRMGVEFPVFFLYKPLAGTEILDMAESLGSFLTMDTMGGSTDYLSGVHFDHEHIRAWQLQAFLFLTHVVFGARLVGDQLRREGPLGYGRRFGAYMSRAIRLGFSPYLAFSYFVFYGYEHLSHPVRVKRVERLPLGWRVLSRVTRLWLGDSRGKGSRAETAPEGTPEGS